MKTVFINCSPQKNLSASAFIADFTSLFVRGRKEKINLRTKADHKRILDKIKDADNIVFAMPLYVDGVPSHVLYFLMKMEDFCKENNLKNNVYVIANNGFIEGRQNETLMQIMENFSERSGLNWCGGLGIGGGVMMNVMRIMTFVFFLMTIINLLYSGIKDGNFFPMEVIADFIQQLLALLILSSWIILCDIKLAICINRKKKYEKHYTRMLLPSFVFIICADIFFIIISIFKGGIFRGWLSAKKPTENKK